MLRWQRAIEFVPRGKPLRWRRYDVPQHLAPETSDALRFRAVEGDLNLLDRRHRFTIEARPGLRRPPGGVGKPSVPARSNAPLNRALEKYQHRALELCGRRRRRNGAQLLQHAEGVEDTPVLAGKAVVIEPRDVDQLHVDALAACRQAHEGLAGVRARDSDATDDFVSAREDLLHVHAHVRE